MTDISQLRKDYNFGSLHPTEIPELPHEWFGYWLDDALHSIEPEPTAMVVSTVSAAGRPSSRVVLLKSFNESGFVFFTNYQSRKGNDITDNPFVSLLFYWPLTERQVRIEGKAFRTDATDSDVYFNSRPEESRINAIISPQSSVIDSREQLLEIRDKFVATKSEIKRPLHWGGYRVEPDLFEFWQGRPGRLHDRVQYKLTAENNWKINRLAP